MTQYNEAVQSYVANVLQFCEYVDDAVRSPDLVDFDVMTKKCEQIIRMSHYIQDEAKRRIYESGTADTTTKAPPGTEGAREPRAKPGKAGTRPGR